MGMDTTNVVTETIDLETEYAKALLENERVITNIVSKVSALSCYSDSLNSAQVTRPIRDTTAWVNSNLTIFSGADSQFLYVITSKLLLLFPLNLLLFFSSTSENVSFSTRDDPSGSDLIILIEENGYPGLAKSENTFHLGSSS